MKTLFLLLVLLNGAISQCYSGDDSLTATELARHLHVFAWITKIDLHEHEFEIVVVHVKGGKVQNTLLKNSAFPTDRPYERIAILGHQTPAGTKISIQPGASGAVAMSLEASNDLVPLTLCIGLPETVSEGDYLLGGDSFVESGKPSAPIKIQDVQDGLVLMLHPKA